MADRGFRDELSVREIPVREILEDGRDRELPIGTAAPGPRRRWPAALLAAAVVLTGARLAASQHHSGQLAAVQNSVIAQNSAAPSSTAGGPSRSQAPRYRFRNLHGA